MIVTEFLGDYVIASDDTAKPVDTGVRATIGTHGSFRTRYAGNVDRVIVELGPLHSALTTLRMQLTVEQAVGLRDLLQAAIADGYSAAEAEYWASAEQEPAA